MNIGVTGWDIEKLIKVAELKHADHVGLLVRIDGTNDVNHPEYWPGIWEYKQGNNPFYNAAYVDSIAKDIQYIKSFGLDVVLRMTMWKNQNPMMAATLHDMYNGNGLRTREAFANVIVNVLDNVHQDIIAISPFSEFGFYPNCTNNQLSVIEQVQEASNKWVECWDSWMPIIRAKYPNMPVIISTPTFDESTSYTSPYPQLTFNPTWGNCIASVHHYRPRPYLENWGDFAWNMLYSRQLQVAKKSTTGPPDLIWEIEQDFDGLPWNKEGLAIAIGLVRQWARRNNIPAYVEELGEAKRHLKYANRYNSDVAYVCKELKVPYSWWVD